MRGRSPSWRSEQTAFGEGKNVSAGDYEVIQDPDVDQSQCLLQALRKELVGAAWFRYARGVVVGEDHGRCIARQCDLDDFAWVDAGLRQGAAKELDVFDQPML